MNGQRRTENNRLELPARGREFDCPYGDGRGDRGFGVRGAGGGMSMAEDRAAEDREEERTRPLVVVGVGGGPRGAVDVVVDDTGLGTHM